MCIFDKASLVLSETLRNLVDMEIIGKLPQIAFSPQM